MTALTFAAFVFGATFLAALAGFQCHRLLPAKYTDDATEGNVRAVLGMLSMLTAVVLGFVTGEAKSGFDNASRIVADTAVRAVSIDRTLAGFGDQAAEIRRELKQLMKEWIEIIGSAAGDTHSDLRVVQRGAELEGLVDSIQKLQPGSASQSQAQDRAVELAMGILHDRWLLKTERAASTPTVFLMVVLAWLTLEFFIFGLFAERNALVVAATVIGAVTVASAFFIVLDLEGPMTGTMRVSTKSLERAVAIMGQ